MLFADFDSDAVGSDSTSVGRSGAFIFSVADGLGVTTGFGTGTEELSDSVNFGRPVDASPGTD